MLAALTSFTHNILHALFGSNHPDPSKKTENSEPLSDEEEVERFIAAALHGDVGYLRSNIHMLNCQDELKNSALGSAAITNQVEVVRLICSTGDACHVDIPDSDKCTPLMLALGAGHAEVCGMLLESGASLKKKDVNGWSCLHHAAAGGSVAMLDRMIRDGLDVGELSAGGQSCLFMAAYGGYFAAVDFLLQRGLDPRIGKC